MGRRINKLKTRLKEGEYKLELKRQLVHALGVLFSLPVIFLPESSATKVLAGSAALAAFGYWYLSKRRHRERYFKDFVKNLKLRKEERESLLKSAKEFKKFERGVLLSAFKNFLRREESPLLSSFYFLLSGLFALLLFGAPFAVIGLLVLGIGDAFATVIGKKWGKVKLIYNKDKSLEGSMAFFVSAFGALIFLFQVAPQYALANTLLLATIAAAAGTLIESMPTLNDNATIPIGVSAVLWLFLLLT